MAKYSSDLRDIFFNLFEVCKIQEFAPELGEDGLKDIVREYDKFVANEIFPVRQNGDEEGVHLIDGKVKAPESFKTPLKNFYENGWFALGQPEEFGGMPAPHAVYNVCSSLSCGANISFDMYPGLSKAAFNCIREIGSAKQHATFLPKMMAGEWGGTMCLTESGAGSDVGAGVTTATPLGDGKFAIKGVKIFISSGESDYYENNIHLVLARTPGSSMDVKGLSLFIVPRFKVSESGDVLGSNDVICTKVEEKMGIHGSATCELTFGQNGECVGELLGDEHDGIKNMFLMMNEARLMCAIQGESQANLATHFSEDYARERSQFGKEIIGHPDMKRTILKMRAISRGMRALVVYTASLFDKSHAGDKSVEPEIALLTPVCKSWCTDEGFKVAVDAIQVHGGYGFCTEYGVEQFARDLKIASIYEGTNGIQSIDFVMRKILKDNGSTFQALAGKVVKTMKSVDGNDFKAEINLMQSSLEDGEKILKRFATLASEKKFDDILEHTMSFLNFSGNLIVSWRLLESALISKKAIAFASEDDKKYYQTKIDDFNTFCRYKLTENIGLSNLMLNWEKEISSVVL